MSSRLLVTGGAGFIGANIVLGRVAAGDQVVNLDKLTYAGVQGREHVVEGSLTDLEARLDPRRFVRIHRSAIVNVAFVEELHKAVDGALVVRLKGISGSELPVARDRMRDLMERLGISS